MTKELDCKSCNKTAYTLKRNVLFAIFKPSSSTAVTRYERQVCCWCNLLLLNAKAWRRNGADHSLLSALIYKELQETVKEIKQRAINSSGSGELVWIPSTSPHHSATIHINSTSLSSVDCMQLGAISGCTANIYIVGKNITPNANKHTVKLSIKIGKRAITCI